MHASSEFSTGEAEVEKNGARTDEARYIPQLQGVLLAHWDITFMDETVQLINECPFGVAEVEFDSLVWAPKLGQRLCEYTIVFTISFAAFKVSRQPCSRVRKSS